MKHGQVSEGEPRSNAEPAPSSLPPLFLHIGRGKSGSSTIQSLAHDYVDFMKAMGVACPLTVYGIVNHSRLAAALRTDSEPETITKFRKDVRRNKRRKVFISAEALLSLEKEGMQKLKRHVGGHREIRLIVYVRDYPNWLQSIYAQRTKRAMNSEHFDDFYKRIGYRVSALADLERWGDEFGWEAMHIRPLLPETLVNGDLVTDLLHALGVNALAPDVETQNMAPNWMSLELQRALTTAAKSRSVPFNLLSARTTRHLFDRRTEGVEPHRVQYLSKDQWLELADLYRADMAALGRHLGVSFPINLPAPTERPFLPDISHVPDEVKANILKDVGSSRYLSKHAPGLIELLQEILSRKAPD